MDEHETTARLLYQGVLRREGAGAEVRRVADQLATGMSPGAVLASMIISPEFSGARLAPVYDWERDSDLARFRTPATDDFVRRVRMHRPLSRDRFEAAWRERFDVELEAGEAGNRAYGAEHKERFWETVNVIATMRGDRPAGWRMLDFGLSVLTAMYRRVLPDLDFVTSDRPVAPSLVEYFTAASRAAGARAHFTNDLTDPSSLTPERAAAMGVFDLVLFTEVLEHLTVDPIALFRNVLLLLKPGGQIYLTTPNFFSYHNLAKIERRIHPQAVFPVGGNADTHFHHREPSMREVLQFLSAAGFEITGFWFSDCWDDATVRARIGPRIDEYSNLAVTAKRPEHS
ncbi:MAG: methyltransferase domain-containing protein [Planctomycetes bacterium]|nr:methyltransferase domain-containing protein [Planctomycetota bacterium]